jgi:hypothetical protein
MVELALVGDETQCTRIDQEFDWQNGKDYCAR